MRDYLRAWTIVSATIVAPLLTNLAGCGGASDDLPREPVSGKVTLDGKPLGSGVIMFFPTGADMATQGGGPIKDGQYSVPRAEGLVPGNYRVTISSGSGSSETVVDKTTDMPGMPPVPAKEAIPAQYNTKSSLTADVKADAKNEFDFALTTKSK